MAMAVETRKRASIDYLKLSEVGKSEAKAPRLDGGGRLKDYSLNKEKALKKKAEKCLSEFCITYTNKSGNHIFDFSTVMYELYKAATVKFYEGANSSLRSVVVVFEQSTDESGKVHVETIIKVHRKIQKGRGSLKFCMNMYHTKNKIMVNGSDIKLFNTNHQQIVNNILEMADIRALDKVMYDAVIVQLNNMTLDKAKLNCKGGESKSLMKADVDQLDMIASPCKGETAPKVGERGSIGERNGVCVPQSLVDSQSLVDCQSVEGGADTAEGEVNQLEFCQHCNQYVDCGVACDSCEYWFHFECEGLSSREVGNEGYICMSCGQDREEELTHSLGDIDMQRSDETEVKQVGNDIEIQIGLGCEKSILGSTVYTGGVIPTTLPVEKNVDMPNSIGENDAVESASGVVDGQDGGHREGEKVRKKMTKLGKSENQDAGKSLKQNKKNSKKQVVENEELQENLGLAKSYISKLERRILDLENSNRILRQDTKISENNNSSGMLLGEPVVGKIGNESFINDKELEALRNQMRNIELEQLKTRLTVMEHSVMSQRFHIYQNYPPPGSSMSYATPHVTYTAPTPVHLPHSPNMVQYTGFQQGFINGHVMNGLSPYPGQALLHHGMVYPQTPQWVYGPQIHPLGHHLGGGINQPVVMQQPGPVIGSQLSEQNVQPVVMQQPSTVIGSHMSEQNVHQNAASACEAIKIDNGGKDRLGDQILKTDLTVQGIFQKISRQNQEKKDGLRSQSGVESESRAVGSKSSNPIEGVERGMEVIPDCSITEVTSQDRVIIDLNLDKSVSVKDQSVVILNYEKELLTNEKIEECENDNRSQSFLVSGRATEVMWTCQE